MMSRNSEEKSNSDRNALTTRTIISARGEGSPGASGASNELTTAGNRYFSRNLLLSKFWQGDQNSIIYENLCEGCGYGVFEAEGRLCDFCRYAINGQFKDTANIYENICEQCGEIYNTDECGTCLLTRLEEAQRLKSIQSPVKPVNRIFGGLFGTLKKARARDKPAKYRKLEIIHNVDGVFRTNETFDLNRICELKRLQYKSDHHIYGKLRKSDDHLMNSLKLDRNVLATSNSKSDPSLHKLSLSSTAITNLDKNLSECDKKTKPLRSYFILQDHVIDWMTSLRRQTYDYNTQHTDDSICNTKSIPSRNFNCCGQFYDIVATDRFQLEDLSLRARHLLLTGASSPDFEYMIESFKRNLMEKRSKRRAIYVKVDDGVNDDNHDRNVPIGDSRGAALLDNKSKRNALYENDSEFVNDILSAFDSFLSRNGGDVAAYDHGKSSTKTDVPEVQSDSAHDVKNSSGKSQDNTASVVADLVVHKSERSTSRRQCRTEILRSLFNNSKVFIKRVNLRGLITTTELSKSLNRNLIAYHSTLSTFLSAIDCLRFAKIDQNRLIKMYVTITTNVDQTDRSAITSTDADTTSTTVVEEEDIYQPIWKFQTVGNPRESYFSDSYDITATNNDSSTNAEDHSDWETDDEFMFSSNHQVEKTSGISVTTTGASTTSETTLEADSSRSLYSLHSDTAHKSPVNDKLPKYQSVCIFFSLDEPKLRAIVYNYDRRRSYFAGHHQKYRKDRGGRYAKPKSDQKSVPELYMNGGCKIATATKTTATSESNRIANFIPDCVQAWRFMLLDINYLDDEEDMYVTKDEILNKYKELDPIPATTLKKSASEGNLLAIPPDKKKTLGERVISKFHAVGFLNISPRPKDKKGSRKFSKRPESTGIYLDGTINKYPIFGATLEQLEYSRSYNVPQFVVDCIKIIEEPDSIQTDGLYRASGNKVDIDIVKKSLKERYDFRMLTTQDIHTITGLLKLFFRELKTPLISEEVYNKLPENLADKDNLPKIKNVIYEMQCRPKDTLKFLLKHLTAVAEASRINRMPASNLAIIWGPCILYSSFTNPMSIARINTLTKVLIENFNVIFNEDERLIS